VFVPTIHHKALEKLVFTWLSLAHAAASGADVVLVLGISGGPLTFLPRVVGKPVVTNIDGLEWQRAKWGALARAVLRIFERCAVRLSTAVVSDAEAITAYCVSRYRRRPWLIPYGAEVVPAKAGDVLRRIGVEPRKYFLVVGRLEPESNVEVVLRAHARIPGAHPLVVVGDAPYARGYVGRLKQMASANVAFAGYVFGEGYRELQSNAYAYISATDIGGTHPALLEAMAHANCVAVNDIREHREIVADTGLLFSAHAAGDLEGKLRWLMDNGRAVRKLGDLARRRAAALYSWDAVAGQYARLFDHCCNRHRGEQVERERSPLP